MLVVLPDCSCLCKGEEEGVAAIDYDRLTAMCVVHVRVHVLISAHGNGASAGNLLPSLSAYGWSNVLRESGIARREAQVLTTLGEQMAPTHVLSARG